MAEPPLSAGGGRGLRLGAGVVALAGLAGLGWWSLATRPREGAGSSSASPRPAAAPAMTPAPAESLLRRWVGGPPADLSAAELRAQLLAMEPRAAMESILAFLRTGADAPTGETLALGPGGVLTGAPTLRVLLLDVLGQLARRLGSGAADEYSRTVLAEKKSPDEWALALRNIGWSEPNAKAFLGAKFREMLETPAWAAAPSDGFLEAFDVAVYSGDPALVDTLQTLAAGGESPLRRAALVALDRLAESAPLAVMERLNARPGLLEERPFLRADYFAKADLRQPAQQVALESYLERTDVGLPEKTKLLNALATPGSFVSDNLLTPTPPVEDGSARQQVLRARLEEWLASGRFPGLQGAMTELRTSLGP